MNRGKEKKGNTTSSITTSEAKREDLDQSDSFCHRPLIWLDNVLVVCEARTHDQKAELWVKVNAQPDCRDMLSAND